MLLSTVTEISIAKHIPDHETIVSLQEDVKIVGNSLRFIDEFLRSILDIHASTANKLEIKLSPTDLYKDCLEPVKSILYQRDSVVDVQVDCPNDLIIMTDCLRLKQIMINLGRNSIKFTQRGFVRYRVAVDSKNGSIEIAVEDSGPGIPEGKRRNLFEKFQASLDVLSQGTGIGLALCYNLVRLLKGRIYLDEDYDSGVVGCPGTRFIVQLHQQRLPSNSILELASSATGTTTAEGAMECIHHRESLVATQPFVIQDNATPSTPDRTINDTERPSRGNLVVKHASTNDVSKELNKLPDATTVLFVDDDNILRRLFSRAIQRVEPSWTISEAACGEAALQLFDSGETFDVVFMDQYMASTEKQLLGTETVRELRRRGVDSTICGLSANNLEETFLQAGADAFSLKPLPTSKEALERELMRIANSRNHPMATNKQSAVSTKVAA